jgi:transcriptional regulator GlxA family with amidase domain
VHHPKLVATLSRMEQNIEAPLAPKRLAGLAGISVRQLERLFAQHLHTTVKKRYLQIRIERARLLLRQTTMPVSEIALATGFSTPMHFSRTYREQFGLTPRQERMVD